MNDARIKHEGTKPRRKQRHDGNIRFLTSLEALCLCVGLLFSSGCAKAPASIPGITDDPFTATVAVKDLPETAPAYGVAAGGALEVNLEARDGPRVLPGQRALARWDGSGAPLECRVAKVIRNVNAATGQAIAWLRPLGGAAPPAGEFVSADIILRVKPKALTVPQEAVYIRDGRTLVLVQRTAKDGTQSYVPTPVETGIASGPDVEIVSGLQPGEEVATQAAIGYLYPDFKANTDD